MLAEAGIPFEVVPGVTAGVAAPAYAGIPVTHREVAGGVAFVTGHESKGSEIDWAGARRVPRDARLLHGRPHAAAHRRAADRARPRRRPSPPRWSSAGRSPGSARSLTTLADVAERARAEGIRAPAITLVGDVAGVAGSSSRGWSRGRCTAAPSPSPARGRRRARWPGGCGPSAPTSSRRRRSASSRWPTRSRRSTATTSCASRRRTAPTCCSTACATRAPSPGRTVAAIGPGTARALRGPRDRARRRARAGGGRGARRGAGGRPGVPRAGGACGRGAGRASRRAARARRAGRRRGAVRDRAPSRSTTPRATRRAPPTTCSSRLPRPCASSSRPAARSTGRGWSRSAPRRARSCVRMAPSPTWKPRRTLPMASIEALLDDVR